MVTLYIASSLDGFIADEKGGIDWLENPELHEKDEDYGYGDFIKEIEVTFMGGNTYEQVLGFGVWHYGDLENYIFTSSLKVDSNHGKAIKSVDEVINIIPKKNCWLIGGGRLNDEFLRRGLIDKIILTTIPVFLGKGIPIFNVKVNSNHFSLEKHRSYPNGVIQYYLSKADK
ncbi:MAG: dihydrofolate reductase family protein [Cytophagales bacterium]